MHSSSPRTIIESFLGGYFVDNNVHRPRGRRRKAHGNTAERLPWQPQSSAFAALLLAVAAIASCVGGVSGQQQGKYLIFTKIVPPLDGNTAELFKVAGDLIGVSV